MPAYKVDWVKVKNEYVTTDLSTREIAKKFNISQSTVNFHSSNENWVKDREEYRRKVEEDLLRKSANKKVKATLMSEAEIRDMWLQTRENIFKSLLQLSTEIENLADARRAVQSYADMEPFAPEYELDSYEDSGFLDAIKGSAPLDDDSNMLPEADE